MAYRLGELAERAGAQLVGDPDVSIEGIGSLSKAVSGQITFLSDHRRRKQLQRTGASAVLLRRADRDLCKLPMLLCDDPYVAFALLTQIFRRAPYPEPGVHASAVISNDCQLGTGVSVGSGAVIAAGVVLGEGCVIGPNCTIGENCVLGARCQLVAGVVLEYDVHLGDDALIQPGAVIGADGFGFADDKGVWVKILQHGRVIIGDNVEIGANTTIDRGTIDDTVIEEGVKIDNQVQIAHNVHIGAHTAIAGCVGIAGSTTIGRHCRIGGAVRIGDHLAICDRVTIVGASVVRSSVREAGMYASSSPLEPYRDWLKNAMRIKQLDRFARRLQRLERMLTKKMDGQS